MIIFYIQLDIFGNCWSQVYAAIKNPPSWFRYVCGKHCQRQRFFGFNVRFSLISFHIFLNPFINKNFCTFDFYIATNINGSLKWLNLNDYYFCKLGIQLRLNMEMRHTPRNFTKVFHFSHSRFFARSAVMLSTVVELYGTAVYPGFLWLRYIFSKAWKIIVHNN